MHRTLQKIIVSCLLALIPLQVVFAETDSSLCSDYGYTVATINGILTSKADAKKNREELERRFKAATGGILNGEPITFVFLFNPSHANGTGDILKAIEQGAFGEESIRDTDLLSMVSDASVQFKTQKILLVPHSQGNFYANALYNVFTSVPNNIPAESISIFGVASPSTHMNGGGSYLTSNTDKVIAKWVGSVPFRKILPPNTNISFSPEDDGGLGHDFINVYLQYKTPEITSGIKKELEKLKVDTARRTETPCVQPPVLTFVDRFDQATLAIVDHPQSVLGVPSAILANLEIKTVLLVSNFGLSVADTILSSVANVGVSIAAASSAAFQGIVGASSDIFAGNVPQNLQASVIGATTDFATSTVVSSSDQGKVDIPQETAPSNTEPVVVPDPTPVVVMASPVVNSSSSAVILVTANASLTDGNPVLFTITGGGNGGSVSPAPGAPVVSAQIATTTLKEATTTQEIVPTEDASAVSTTLVISVPQCADSLDPSRCILAPSTVHFEWAVEGAATSTAYYLLDENGISASTTETLVDVEIPESSTFVLRVSAVDNVGIETASSSVKVSTTARPAPAATSTILVADGDFVYSDLNKNGVPDNQEMEVVMAESATLPAGNYLFTNLIIGASSTLSLAGSPTSTSPFKGVSITARNLTISSGSKISADYAGYDARNPGPGSPASGWAGASYGGIGEGSTTTLRYGSAVKPTDLGSAGAWSGGKGGGAINLQIVGTFKDDGIISANGNNTSAGGSINAEVGVFAGGGVLRADGGSAYCPNDCYRTGAGGRIAVHYATSTFSGTSEAKGGCTSYDSWHPTCGGSGTVGFFDTTTGDFYAGPSWRFEKDTEFSANRIFLQGASVSIDQGAVVNASDVALSSGSGLVFGGDAVLNAEKVSAVDSGIALSGDQTFNVKTLEMQGGTLSIQRGKVLSLALQNLTIGAGTVVSANETGYARKSGPGAPFAEYIGASYGGIGVGNSATSTYGSPTSPIDFGSGGSYGNTYGGGAIRPDVSQAFANNGAISANGGTTSSGGSIYVTTQTFSGLGTFAANGGGTYWAGSYYGPGGGGRIAVRSATSTFSGSAVASGGGCPGCSGGKAGNGTVVFESFAIATSTEPAATSTQETSTPTPFLDATSTPPIDPATSTPTLSSEDSILSFIFNGFEAAAAPVIDEGAGTIDWEAPFGTDITALTPTFTISPKATSSPVSGMPQDFSDPVAYAITAEDGSVQYYIVSVTVLPDTEPPTISSYTLNGSAGNAAFNSATSTIAIALTSSESVNWKSLKIENAADSGVYKIFYSGAGCVDGTNTCTKTWDGSLSSGLKLLLNGEYRLKVHIQDAAGNDYNDYLSPFTITVNLP